MCIGRHSRRRPWFSLVPQALLALAVTLASWSVFLESEQVELPAPTVATVTDRAAGLKV